MTLSDEDLMAVMAYADGESEGDELAHVEALLGRDAEARELAASIQALGDGVRTAHDIVKCDVTAAVMKRVLPNDLDKARLRKNKRTRMAVVLTTIGALAAGAYLYTRGGSQISPSAQKSPISAPSAAVAINGNPGVGVEIDSVDTPGSVSVFYVPIANETTTDKPAATGSSVVVWIDEPAGAP